MNHTITAPWHAESYDRLIHEELPRLLAERLPLTGYKVQPAGSRAVNIRLTLAGPAGDVVVDYSSLPYPDADGVFVVDGQQCVVVPVASHADDLQEAVIRCTGDQLMDYLASHLGHVTETLAWDNELVRTWLPLDRLIHTFLTTHPTVELLDQTNWLAKHAHLRRLRVLEAEPVITPAHFGRACPVEAPEGPEIGHLITIASGAAIRDQRLVIVDARPAASLGLTASTIPFLEHNALGRLLMAASMMREWMPPPDPEPALVQTGNEPDDPAFWCGRNLLTAFIGWDADAFEDAIVISESCARRLAYPHPIEPGDKLSNRHGSKGIVSRILPDDQMPHLTDGTPVEVIFHVTGLFSRLNFGQVREAVMSRIAQVEGRPALVPPFGAPGEDELRARLVGAGLPVDGMERLTLRSAGKPMLRPSTAGWVYWGKTYRTAAEILQGTLIDYQGVWQGEPAYGELRDAGAYEQIREHWNTRAAEREDSGSLAMRVAAGPVDQGQPPTPMFVELQRRLGIAGIRAELLTTPVPRLVFRLEPPAGNVLRLATPMLHPWLRGWSSTGWAPQFQLATVGVDPTVPEYAALVEANQRMERMLAVNAPSSLRQPALAGLEQALGDFFGALLTPHHLRFNAHVRFSGRAVIAPGPELGVEQVGLPEEMVWTMFGPLLIRELGDERAVHARSAEATIALDALMARTWVLVYHGAGIYTPVDAPFLAFHPVRLPGRVIRLHPLVLAVMDADFDGDQVEVFLPLTERAQAEAGTHLSLAAYMTQHPHLMRWFAPRQLALWGLADLSLTSQGTQELAGLGIIANPSDGFVTKAPIIQAIQHAFEHGGFVEAAGLAERLSRRGFERVRESGASISPFFGASVTLPPIPQSDDPATWQAYSGEVLERFGAFDDYTDPELGVHLISVKSGARGNGHQLVMQFGALGFMAATGQFPPTIVRHGYHAGLTPQELFAMAAAYWMAVTNTEAEAEQLTPVEQALGVGEGYKVLARARRSPAPGIVFARAAITAEEDPLTNVDSRLFVGLPAAEQQ